MYYCIIYKKNKTYQATHALFRRKEIILHSMLIYNFSLSSCVYVNVLKYIVVLKFSQPILNLSFRPLLQSERSGCLIFITNLAIRCKILLLFHIA